MATDLGVFISADTDGGTYARLGDGLPNVPVFSLELKPKASAAEPDTLIVATQGRGVYRYVFAEDGKPAIPLGDQPSRRRRPAPGAVRATGPGGLRGEPGAHLRERDRLRARRCVCASRAPSRSP